MHEAGIARSILAEIGHHEPGWERLRVLVRGGRSEPHAFDAALRLHLSLADPGLELSRVEIVHLRGPGTCAACGARFERVDSTAPCPHCGGPAWPDHTPEQIEVELVHGAASSRPATAGA